MLNNILIVCFFPCSFVVEFYLIVKRLKFRVTPFLTSLFAISMQIRLNLGQIFTHHIYDAFQVVSLNKGWMNDSKI